MKTLFKNNQYHIFSEPNDDREGENVYIENLGIRDRFDRIGSLAMLENEGQWDDGTPCPDVIVNKAYDMIEKHGVNY